MPKLYRDFTTQPQIDEQYDVEKSVPDFTVYARHYIDESKLARHRLKCELDVAYGPTRDEHVDIFPAYGRNAPILLFIHGGYWRILSSKEFSCVAFGPVAAGVTLVNVNYSLCPKVTVDEIVRQVRAAVAWTYRNAASFGGDRSRLYVSGHSAGGHLTAMAIGTDWEGDYGLPADTVKGGFSVSGVFDLRPLRYSNMQPMLQLDDGIIQRNSPLFHIKRSRVPVLFTYGGQEPAEFRRQTEDYVQAWQYAGNTAELLAQPDANHFTAIYGFEDPKSELCKRLLRFMQLKSV
jgi:arylformamidase